MEVAVQVVLVPVIFTDIYTTDSFEDWRVGPSFKVRSETASQARTGRHDNWNYC